jgi:hypothetical protein
MDLYFVLVIVLMERFMLVGARMVGPFLDACVERRECLY